jgi:hypothetical protein
VTDSTDTLPPLPLNTILILAGTLHGIHAITNRLTPGSGGGGLEAFEAEGWGGKVFLTATGGSLRSEYQLSGKTRLMCRDEIRYTSFLGSSGA